MSVPDLVDRLVQHRTVGSAPRAELEWLVAHGSLRHFTAGEVVSTKEARVDWLYIMLSGRIAIFVDRGAGVHKMMEWRGGDVVGILPYSRMVNPPGDTITQETTEALAIPRELFPELIRECYHVTSILVHTMIDRARVFTSSDLHDEKMISLGKLSAGLAHELNNPAAAIERSAALLEERLNDAEQATLILGASRLTPEQLSAVEKIRDSCAAKRVSGILSPIEQAEREEAIADWLEAHALDVKTAEPLADTAVTIDALNQLAAAVDGPALNSVLKWAASGCTVRGLASEIQDAAMRISGLVIAIKGFTHMDQATVAGPVDLVQGLENTIAVMRAKARKKSISVGVNVEPDTPRVRGFVGELNQVWGNLIDNALDAVPESGRVQIWAHEENGRVVVRIVDNGPGIPDGIRERIFDPFFTTKPLGQGTGLGLDIVRRLVRHNDGEITVESQPGHTEFRVSLPIAADEAEGGTP